jgi:hypothetical protein
VRLARTAIVLTLSETAVAVLRAHRTRQNEERLAENRWQDHGLILPTSPVAR